MVMATLVKHRASRYNTMTTRKSCFLSLLVLLGAILGCASATSDSTISHHDNIGEHQQGTAEVQATAQHEALRLRVVESESSIDHERPQRRQLFDFWSLLFALGPCGPGPLHHKHCDDSSSSGGGGGSSGGSSSGYYDGSGGDGSSAVNYDAANGDDAGRVSSTQTILDPSSMSFWLLLVALAAVVMAIVAMVMGQRKREKPQHALTGSVARRMELFSTFADGALCGNEARPDRVVEMTASADDYEKAGASV